MNFSYSIQFVFAEVTSRTVCFFFLLYVTPFSDGDIKWKLNVKPTTFSFYCKFIQVQFTCYLNKVRCFYSESRSDMRSLYSDLRI